MEKSVGNSNFGGKFSSVNPSVIQILAENFLLLLPTKNSSINLSVKKLNYRQIFLLVNEICVTDRFFHR